MTLMPGVGLRKADIRCVIEASRLFDRRAVLQSELDRITRTLVDQYHATRIILFGSLATELRILGDWVHQWSDIDLAVVANTPARFSDRIAEI